MRLILYAALALLRQRAHCSGIARETAARGEPSCPCVVPFAVRCHRKLSGVHASRSPCPLQRSCVEPSAYICVFARQQDRASPTPSRPPVRRSRVRGPASRQGLHVKSDRRSPTHALCASLRCAPQCKRRCVCYAVAIRARRDGGSARAPRAYRPAWCSSQTAHVVDEAKQTEVCNQQAWGSLAVAWRCEAAVEACGSRAVAMANSVGFSFWA